MPKSSKIIVTAALPYANGSIHIGHLLEYIQADIYARFLKLTGHDALYICASDMHGTPIEVNAAKAGKKPEQFAVEFWKEHQHDFKSFLIEFDNYYKTHSPENKELAELFYAQLKKKGCIIRKKINVIYCTHCARTLPDRYVKGTCPHCTTADQYGDVCENCSSVLKAVDLINPHCSICARTPIQKESEHYFFTLGKFKKPLRQWLGTADIQPEVRNWLGEWMGKGLDDWCISRDAPYFGFEIPQAEKETGEKKYFYVWMDAPIGYISSTKNYTNSHHQKWEDYWKKGRVQHFIGKDISYFHFLFWPAMLMAMDIPLPKLTVHGFITVNGQKMSKSRGTFFTAQDFLTLYPPESLRFYYASHLDRKLVDIDLDFENFKAVNNHVLVGSLSNFCYRVLTFAEKNYGEINKIAVEQELTAKVKALIAQVEHSYTAQDFKAAVKHILEIADIGNHYFQQAEPWKDPLQRKKEVGWCVNLARNLAIIATPILPLFSKKIAVSLGTKTPHWKDINFKWGGKLKAVEMLGIKIEKIPSSQTFPLQLKVGKVTEVRDHPNADSLYIFAVDFGSFGKKQVVTSLKKHLPKTAFQNKTIVFCVNLKPAKFRGEISEAMILAAEDGTTIVPLHVEKTKPGEDAVFQGLVNNTNQITIEEMGKLNLQVRQGKVFFEGKKLASVHEDVLAPGVRDGAQVR